MRYLAYFSISIQPFRREVLWSNGFLAHPAYKHFGFEIVSKSLKKI